MSPQSSNFLRCVDACHSAQRNTYLTGFCLFLSLVLTRTFQILLDLIHTQEEYAKLKQDVRLACPFQPHLLTVIQTSKTSRDQISSNDQGKQIAELKKKLAEAEAKTRDYGAQCLLFLRAQDRLLTLTQIF